LRIADDGVRARRTESRPHEGKLRRKVSRRPQAVAHQAKLRPDGRVIENVHDAEAGLRALREQGRDAGAGQELVGGRKLRVLQRLAALRGRQEDFRAQPEDVLHGRRRPEMRRSKQSQELDPNAVRRAQFLQEVARDESAH
jgi:hypothetical protein